MKNLNESIIIGYIYLNRIIDAFLLKKVVLLLNPKYNIILNSLFWYLLLIYKYLF